MSLVFAFGGVLPAELGADEDLARRILVRARLLAPCMPVLSDASEVRHDVLAILKGVYKRADQMGTGVIASQGRNGTNRSYRDVRTAFWDEDIAMLLSLCPGGATVSPALPHGSFPRERPLANLWPEGEYS